MLIYIKIKIISEWRNHSEQNYGIVLHGRLGGDYICYENRFN